MEHVYWGEEHNAGQIEKFLSDAGIRYQRYDDTEKLQERIVDRLQQGKVIGWFQGRFEWGPRALGTVAFWRTPKG